MNNIGDSIAYHRAHPDVSLDQYVKGRTNALGEIVNRKKRLYLDKRFWIIARDVDRGTEKAPEKRELVSTLKERVRENEVICPISDSVFIELYKQEDTVSRTQTIVLIDELSAGITLLPYPTRVEIEMAYLFYEFGEHTDLCPIENVVWTKVSNVFGIIHPYETGFAPETELALQKSFFDHMWNIPLREMEGYIGGTTLPQLGHEELAKRLTAGNSAHSNAIPSFKAAYKVEMNGAVSVFVSSARQLLESMFENETGSKPYTGPVEQERHDQQLLHFFSALIRKNKVARALRTLHITSLCHAAYRWDKNRKFRKNDFLDFYHASAAVGYCDAFLTEKPLHSLLHQKHLKVQSDFGCKIICDPQEALEYVTNV